MNPFLPAATAARSVNPNQLSPALQAYLNGQDYESKWGPYYSRVHIAATEGSNGGSGATYVIGKGGEFTAFGYHRQGPMDAGGLPGVQATSADTNITADSQTNAGEALEVEGISIIVLGSTDAGLLKQADANISVKLRMNANKDYPLGVPSMLPSCGGLFGVSDAYGVAPSLIASTGVTLGQFQHGMPQASSFFPLPEPVIWSSAGKVDSTLQIVFKVERAITYAPNWVQPARAAVAPGQATFAAAPWTPPDASTLGIDYMVVLIARTVTNLSRN